MQVDSTRFARAVRIVNPAREASRVRFDVELSDGSATPALVETYADGVFRLRIGPHTLPDYSLVVAAATKLRDATIDPHKLAVQNGDATLTLDAQPLRVCVARRGETLLTSITDEHFRGFARFPAFGCDGERWIASFALASGEPVYGLGEKASSLDRRGQLLRSRVEGALGVNTGLSYKNVPFCWSPRGWGLFVNTPGDVTHGVGHPQWSHRSNIALVDDEALDLLLIVADSPAQ